MKRVAVVVVVVIGVLIWALYSSATESANPALQREISKIVATQKPADTICGVSVILLNNGKPVYTHNSKKLFSVASNMKLVTTAVALVKLGADYQLKTILYRRGDVRLGTLNGDIIVRGGADPDIASRFYKSPATVIDSWVERLNKLGIKNITGDIIADDGLFDRTLRPAGWPSDQFERWYCAEVSALSINDNCIDVSILPGTSKGSPAHIEICPNTSFITVKNLCATTNQRSKHIIHTSRKHGTNIITVSGNCYSRAAKQTFPITFHNPPLLFATYLKERLVAGGIEVTGRPRVEADTYRKGNPVLIATHTATLATTVAITNKRSQNLYSELLFKLLGAKLADSGSFTGGAQAIGKFLHELDIDQNQFQITDGCGLSRETKLSPYAITKLLAFMKQHQSFRIFHDSLAVAGYDGTMKKRLKGEKTKGKAVCKTGYISGVSALSGYATAADGRQYAFCILTNKARRHPRSAVKKLEDKIVSTIVKSK